ncbi:FG-GAP-like repeat-containing protein [Actinacidiphila glaucinigra]|uniref:FG-GAP-like repeat-containing protein n=1 Tax=Actinacidiphila glaucinigra TaxID=235986 RepID=UPI0033D9A47C
MLAASVAAALGVAQLPAMHHAPSAGRAKEKTAAPRLLDEAAAVSRARTSGKRVEVTALRDASSTTWARPDGSFELEARAVAFRAKVDGTWRPVDTRLHRVKSGGWAPAAVNNPVVFSGGSRKADRVDRSRVRGQIRPVAVTAAQDSASSTDLVTFSSDGHQLTMTWPGSLPTPVIDGPRALYQEVLPGVDLLLTARDAGFSNLLIVKTPQAAESAALAEVSYGLTSPDLAFTLDPVTRVVHAKDSTGREIAVSPTPYMWDSAGKPATTEGDDPQPSRPFDEPLPSAGPDVDPPEDPADAPDPNASHTPDDSDDTAAPTDDTSASPAAYQHRTTTNGTRPAALTTSTGADSVLSLAGLAGPQPGSHDALTQITLTDHTLSIRPDLKLLTGDSTVYPVFIDPSMTGHTNNWTTAYRTYPTSSFWNGTNFNDGTDTARVGYEFTTGGLSRSFFQLSLDSKLKGAAVSSASFYALETYSWSCSARSVQLWRTGSISSSTTWNNQPSWTEEINAQSVAHGYSSSCPDNWVNFPATSLAQDAADNGWTKITLGLRAATEDSSYAWKKFEASSSNSPYLKITYNHKPNEPTGLDMSPGPKCDIEAASTVGKSDITFSATSSDTDGDLKYLDFELWQDGSSTKIFDGNQTVDSSGHASVKVVSSKFVNGKTYWWRVRAIDSTGAASSYAPPSTDNCGFVYDAAKPNSPDVASADYPEENSTGSSWSTKPFGTAGSVTFSPNGSTDTVTYKYSLNTTSYNNTKAVSPGASATVTIQPKVAGSNVLYAVAVDSAGNTSAQTAYVFFVTPRDTGDGPGDTTGDARPDLYVIDVHGNLRLYPADAAGDIHRSLPAAHNAGRPLPDGYWTDSTNQNPALITHNGDYIGADGLTDLIARMPDGKLYAYPGDGYGSVDVSRRLEILLPAQAPDGVPVPQPGELSQILSIGDLNNDGRPDMFATAGTALWFFTGYTGAAFTQAERVTTTTWDDRDLISVEDVNGDGARDLILRKISTATLWVRFGKPDGGGGTLLASITHAVDSLTGVDTNYATGWSPTAITWAAGTPDVNGDHIPDIWARNADGTVDFYKGTKTSAGTPVNVISTDWNDKKALG